MTPKQQKFCDEHIKTGNATQSAVSAVIAKRRLTVSEQRT